MQVLQGIQSTLSPISNTSLNSLHNNNFTGALSRKEQFNDVAAENAEEEHRGNSLFKTLVGD